MNPLNSLPPFQNLSLQSPNVKELLGPLYDFAGVWTNDPFQGWNLIAVPGPPGDVTPPSYFNSTHGFILETIPYIETISFKPISVTLNRGEFVPGSGTTTGDNQEIQQIGALLYEQRIESAGCNPDNPNYDEITKFFEQRGFAKGTAIHAEQGMLLNIRNFQDDGGESFQIARMGTIPHGNTMLCLGNSTSQSAPDILANGTNCFPTTVDPSKNLPLDYQVNTYLSPDHSLSGYPFYPDFIPSSPNQTLINANEGVTFASTNKISLSTLNGTGGLLSIPFVGGSSATRINTTKMTVDYWLSKIEGSNDLRLQYVQNIDLVFPTAIDPTLPINWPHIGLNTLKRISLEVK